MDRLEGWVGFRNEVFPTCVSCRICSLKWQYPHAPAVDRCIYQQPLAFFEKEDVMVDGFGVFACSEFVPLGQERLPIARETVIDIL